MNSNEHWKREAGLDASVTGFRQSECCRVGDCWSADVRSYGEPLAVQLKYVQQMY